MQPTEPSKMYLVSPLLNLGKLSIRMHRKGILNNYHTQLHYLNNIESAAKISYCTFTCILPTHNMKLVILLLRVVLVFSTTEKKDQQTQLFPMDTTACPPWFVWQNNSGTDRYHSQCTCINNTDLAVKCDQLAQRSYLLLGYCMTCDDSSGDMYLGRSIFYNYQKPTNHFYIELPTNISHLNDFMCGPLNRKGLLCRNCLDGFGPSVVGVTHAHQVLNM